MNLDTAGNVLRHVSAKLLSILEAPIMREDQRRAREHAKILRRQLTHAEVLLWSRLKRRADTGFRFRRQHPIGPFVADFACISARLVIEVDGDTHGTDAERAYDRRRDAYMETEGWRVIRVSNSDVYKRLPEVVDRTFQAAPPPPRG